MVVNDFFGGPAAPVVNDQSGFLSTRGRPFFWYDKIFKQWSGMSCRMPRAKPNLGKFPRFAWDGGAATEPREFLHICLGQARGDAPKSRNSHVLGHRDRARIQSF